MDRLLAEIKVTAQAQCMLSLDSLESCCVLPESLILEMSWIILIDALDEYEPCYLDDPFLLYLSNLIPMAAEVTGGSDIKFFLSIRNGAVTEFSLLEQHHCQCEKSISIGCVLYRRYYIVRQKPLRLLVEKSLGADSQCTKLGMLSL